MTNIGIWITLVRLKRPVHFLSPGTLWRDKLCVLFLGMGWNEITIYAMCPLCFPSEELNSPFRGLGG